MHTDDVVESLKEIASLAWAREVENDTLVRPRRTKFFRKLTVVEPANAEAVGRAYQISGDEPKNRDAFLNLEAPYLAPVAALASNCISRSAAQAVGPATGGSGPARCPTEH